MLGVCRQCAYRTCSSETLRQADLSGQTEPTEPARLPQETLSGGKYPHSIPAQFYGCRG